MRTLKNTQNDRFPSQVQRAFHKDLINKTNHSGDALEDGYNTPYFETLR